MAESFMAVSRGCVESGGLGVALTRNRRADS